MRNELRYHCSAQKGLFSPCQISLQCPERPILTLPDITAVSRKAYSHPARYHCSVQKGLFSPCQISLQCPERPILTLPDITAVPRKGCCHPTLSPSSRCKAVLILWTLPMMVCLDTDCSWLQRGEPQPVPFSSPLSSFCPLLLVAFFSPLSSFPHLSPSQGPLLWCCGLSMFRIVPFSSPFSVPGTSALMLWSVRVQYCSFPLLFRNCSEHEQTTASKYWSLGRKFSSPLSFPRTSALMLWSVHV